MEKATIYISGIIGEDTQLLDVIRQYKSYKNPDSIEVIIDSVGGCVDTGMSIFNYLRKLGVPVTTLAKKAYSIAASIFMAGDNRIVEEGDARIMIHMPWAEAVGNSEHFENVAKELKSLEKQFADFYSTYTSIDAESITELLKNETYLDSTQAVEIGIATEVRIPMKAVAIYNNIIEDKPMTKIEKFMNALSDFFTAEELEDAPVVEINCLVLQDANGVDIDFPDLESEDEPAVGDKATIDEQPASGEVVMPDGSTLVFEGGELMEIRPAEEAPEEDAPVEEEAVAEAEPSAEASAEEPQAEEEEEINIEELISNIVQNVVAKVSEEFKSENDALKAEIKALKKLVGSDDADVSPLNNQPNTNNNSGKTLAQILKERKSK